MLSEALEAPSARLRNRGLQRLGDVSLFIAGFFAQSFARKLIDIDYHIAMGGRAYGDARRDDCPRHAAACWAGVRRAGAEIPCRMVDALNEVSETSYQHYRPGHPASLRDLAEDRQPALLRHCCKRLGVDPTAAGGTAFAH